MKYYPYEYIADIRTRPDMYAYYGRMYDWIPGITMEMRYYER